MEAKELQSILEALGISPGAFARVCGAGERVGQRWAAGTMIIPPGAAALARLAGANAGRMAWPDMATLLRQEAERLDNAGR